LCHELKAQGSEHLDEEQKDDNGDEENKEGQGMICSARTCAEITRPSRCALEIERVREGRHNDEERKIGMKKA
jgi:hypothetical protein